MVGVFLAIVAFVGILLLARQPTSSAPVVATTGPVVVAKNLLPLSAKITPDDVELKTVELTAVLPGALVYVVLMGLPWRVNVLLVASPAASVVWTPPASMTSATLACIASTTLYGRALPPRATGSALLTMVRRAATRQRIPVSLCGEMASDPALLTLLVGLGLTEFSMTPGAIPVAKQVLAELRSDELRALARRVLRLATVDDIERELLAALSRLTLIKGVTS